MNLKYVHKFDHIKLSFTLMYILQPVEVIAILWSLSYMVGCSDWLASCTAVIMPHKKVWNVALALFSGWIQALIPALLSHDTASLIYHLEQEF